MVSLHLEKTSLMRTSRLRAVLIALSFGALFLLQGCVAAVAVGAAAGAGAGTAATLYSRKAGTSNEKAQTSGKPEALAPNNANGAASSTSAPVEVHPLQRDSSLPNPG